MENLLKTEWVSILNKKRPGNLPEWVDVPDVLSEDTMEKVFDIVDTKYLGDPIVRPHGTGHATYYNGDDGHTYELRFIKYEEFVNQFEKTDEESGKKFQWNRNMSRPDYIAYDLTEQKAYFVIHELSEGSIANKKSDAMRQLLNTVLLFTSSSALKDFYSSFEKRLCVVSANGCVTESPLNMAQGFMEAYINLPDPLPLNNKSITSRGFDAIQTKVVKL